MTRHWSYVLSISIGVLLLSQLLIPKVDLLPANKELKTVYVSVNQQAYGTYRILSGDRINLTVKQGDLIQLALLENPIMPYTWQASIQSGEGFELLSQCQLKAESSQLLLPPKEELRYDRSVFEYLMKEKGAYHLSFFYLPEVKTVDYPSKTYHCLVSLVVE